MPRNKKLKDTDSAIAESPDAKTIKHYWKGEGNLLYKGTIIKPGDEIPDYVSFDNDSLVEHV